MLRLTRAPHTPSAVVLKAEGQIVGEWVAVLEKECRELLGSYRSVVLDLGGISYLDRQAVRTIRELARGSVSVVNSMPLVEEILNEDSAE